MWMTCDHCHTKYRDFSASGAATVHRCKPIVLVTINRAGATLEVDPADVGREDIEISRRTAFVAQTKSDYIVTPPAAATPSAPARSVAAMRRRARDQRRGKTRSGGRKR